MFERIDRAIEHFRRGGMLVVVDNEDRENEGDLCLPASLATSEAITFMARQGCGLICVALEEARADELKLPLMVASEYNQTPNHTAFTISVEAASGVTTGISAQDRAHTIRLLADSGATAADFVRPGHIFPLRARREGVLARAGHTEAGVDLAKLAGLPAAAVICEVMGEDGKMLRVPDLHRFAQRHGLPLIRISDLIAYRRSLASATCVATASLPLDQGEFRARIYLDHTGREHVALTMGTPSSEPLLVRIHSECLSGDVFGSRRCDCGAQLQAALSAIARQRTGAVIYLRQEGRGIGLTAKVRAYALQEAGLDTVEANRELGFPPDARDFGIAAAILRDLGAASVRLMTNNPAKIQALESAGIQVVERIPLQSEPTPENIHYLRTKRSKLGHSLDLPELLK